MFAFGSYPFHPVETGVSTNNDIVLYSDSGKQVSGLLILNEDDRDASEHSSEKSSPPFEERLETAEYRRDKIYLTTGLTGLADKVVPKVVYGEYQFLWLYGLHHPASVGNGIYRKIEHPVCKGIVFPQIISARGEKSQENLCLRTAALVPFY